MKRYFLLLFLTLPVIPSFSQSLPSWVPKNGLAAYYGFDKDARDASGNRNDGVVHEATLIPDRFGIDSSAYNFNGTSSFIDVRDTASMNPVSGLSLSMWVHTETPHGVAGVLGKWNNYGGSFGIGREQFCMNVSDTDNGINFGLKTKDEFPVYPHEKEIIYRNGRWNHYIGTYDGAYAKLYVNGILASTYRASGPIPVYQQKFEIGRISGGQPTCATSFYFTGDIDDVGLWNRALSEKEIKALFSGCPGFMTAKITAAGTTSLCEGDTVTLTSNTESGATYQWFRNDTLLAGAIDTFFVARKTGNYSVIVSKGECTSTSEPVQVMVNPIPVPVVSHSTPLTFCDGGFVTLSVIAEPGSAFAWNNGLSAPSIAVTQSGTYSVTVTTRGCSGTTQPVTVEVKPNPLAEIAASGPTALCDGDSVDLTATGGETYRWSTGESTQSITVTRSGVFSAEVIKNGCKSQASETVTIFPLPDVSMVPLDPFIDVQLGSVLLRGTPSGGIFTGSGVEAGNFIPGNAGLGKHRIMYSVTSVEGCENSSSQAVVVYDTTGVHCTVYDTLVIARSAMVADTLVITGTVTREGQTFSREMITLYPNPAKTILNIRFTDFAILNNYSLVIRNALGQQLFVSDANVQEQRVITESWAKGVYVVSLNDPNGFTVEVRKIIIQ